MSKDKKPRNEVTILGTNYDGALSDRDCGGYLEDDEWDYRDEMTDEEIEAERIEEELENFHCTCGAYVISEKSHRVIHIADCLCGYG